jgi:hypothetical protein
MQVLTTKYNKMEFTGDWQKVFGQPELSGAWIFYGKSFNGKTTFVMQLCKYLTNFGKVAYNSLEEGQSETIKQAMLRVNMREVARKIVLLDREPISELKQRLSKKKSPKIIVIDSLQYSRLTYPEYITLKEEFPNHLFIFISHAKGANPKGNTAESIYYDASIKGRIEGYRVFVNSRYGSGGEAFMDIWPEKAQEYWGVTA